MIPAAQHVELPARPRQITTGARAVDLYHALRDQGVPNRITTTWAGRFLTAQGVPERRQLSLFAGAPVIPLSTLAHGLAGAGL